MEAIGSGGLAFLPTPPRSNASFSSSPPPISRPFLSSSSPFRRSRGGRRACGSSVCSVAKMVLTEVQPSLELKKKATDASAELKGTTIFLVGIDCTLKNNLGKLLADVLRYFYFNSDDLVIQAIGSDADVESFRESETEVLRQLSSMGRLVVCAGDGAVQSSTNLGLLRHGISVWVDIPLDLIANEVSKTSAAPSPSEQASSSTDTSLKVLDEISAKYNKLRDAYGTADATLSIRKLATERGYSDSSSITLEDAAMEAFRQIEKLIRRKKMLEDAAKPF